MIAVKTAIMAQSLLAYSGEWGETLSFFDITRQSYDITERDTVDASLLVVCFVYIVVLLRDSKHEEPHEQHENYFIHAPYIFSLNSSFAV